MIDQKNKINNKIVPLIFTDFYPSQSHSHEGLCVHEQIPHLPGSENALVLAPSIKYPPFPRYRYVRSHRPESGWQNCEKNVFRIPGYYFPVFGEKFLVKKIIVDSLALLQWRGNDFDIIHANWAYRSGYIASQVSEYLNIPLILTIWGSDIDIWIHEKRKQRYIFQALEKAYKIITQNKSHKEKLLQFGVPNDKIVINPMGIDTQIFTIKHAKKPNKNFTFAIIGNLFRDKGHQEVLQSLSMCNPDIRLVVIGDGPEMLRLVYETASYNLRDRVVFTGAKNPEEIPELLQKSDALIIGSRHEGGPKVLLEALSCGKPVVATKVGFASEIIHPECGKLVEIGDIFAMAKAMDYIAENQWDAQKIRQTALPFDWQNFRLKMEKTYISVLGEHLTCA
ncbi:MAG: glycosyltransferase family 4 protein [Calditrichaeota bacterium]|nr:MAG: glycosyltransferase family 4 protein [Calditrichota bacterium]